MADLFNAEAMYDEDYLRFFAAPAIPTEHNGDVGDPHSEADVEVIWRLSGLEPGMRVLDLACGHGRIANRLAARGCRVIGLDSSAVFLDRARSDAAELGVSVEYVIGDMREIPWTDQFDVVVNWGTAFGYFDDAVNRDVLRQIRQALRPEGQLIMDLNNLFARLRSYQPSRVEERGNGDMFVDRFHLAPLTSRLEVERTIIRDGHVRRVPFVVRLFSFPEIKDWLLTQGFTAVAAHGEEGNTLTAEDERMVVIAR